MEELIAKAIAVVREEGRSSVSLIQHKLKIGYNRAYDIQEELVVRGIVSEANHVGKREVFSAPAAGKEE